MDLDKSFDALLKICEGFGDEQRERKINEIVQSTASNEEDRRHQMALE